MRVIGPMLEIAEEQGDLGEWKKNLEADEDITNNQDNTMQTTPNAQNEPQTAAGEDGAEEENETTPAPRPSLPPRPSEGEDEDANEPGPSEAPSEGGPGPDAEPSLPDSPSEDPAPSGPQEDDTSPERAQDELNGYLTPRAQHQAAAPKYEDNHQELHYTKE